MRALTRDVRGRIGGALLFTAFLVFHLDRLARGWNAFDAPARANSLLITATIVFFLASYFLRSRSVQFPRGWRETLYPLFCAGLPLAIYYSTELMRLIPSTHHYYSLLDSLFRPSGNSLLGWNLFSIILVLAGNIITFLGIVSLRCSFSLMVEARKPVVTGLYAYVRHPLYVGEIVASTGILVFRFSAANAFLLLLFVLCQIYRAALEEQKLLSAFPEYGHYRQKTGAFFPRVNFQTRAE
jgi:protein-S-isoprenylcysteine O-methyltransferase Ste14